MSIADGQVDVGVEFLSQHACDISGETVDDSTSCMTLYTMLVAAGLGSSAVMLKGIRFWKDLARHIFGEIGSGVGPPTQGAPEG